MKPFEIINLDDDNERFEFGMLLDGCPAWEAGEILGTDQKAAETLMEYAGAKNQAFQHRLKGRISDAKAWESQCEYLYSQLPDSVRW